MHTFALRNGPIDLGLDGDDRRLVDASGASAMGAGRGGATRERKRRDGKQETQWLDHAQLHQRTRRTLPATTGPGNAATARRRGVESRHTTSGAEQTS